MAINAVVLPVDLHEPIRCHELNPDDAEEYRGLVGGHTKALELDRPPSRLYSNEESGLNPLGNLRATALLWAHHSALRGRDIIAGPAFIVGPPDDDGRDTSAPAPLVELLCDTRRYRVEVQVAGDDKWYGNGLVFDDWLRAYIYGSDLAQRWTQVVHFRVVPRRRRTRRHRTLR